jgi:hypothetical protein
MVKIEPRSIAHVKGLRAICQYDLLSFILAISPGEKVTDESKNGALRHGFGPPVGFTRMQRKWRKSDKVDNPACHAD